MVLPPAGTSSACSSGQRSPSQGAAPTPRCPIPTASSCIAVAAAASSTIPSCSKCAAYKRRLHLLSKRLHRLNLVRPSHTGALHISGRLKAFADGECVGASGSWRKRRKAATEISATADGSYSCSQSFTSCSSSAASRAVPRHSQVPMEVRTSSLGGKPLYADDRSPAPPTASPCPDGSELQPPSRRHHGRRSADRHCSVRGHEKAVNALPPKLLGSRRYRARRAAGLLAGSLPISG
eukprot:GHVT01097494.1.p1 GENE.GHVT01097494.1~~GHVT01097494.1.p1  ORF type:complete len:237 (-),score=31.71 GHVT01097494.1:112-822(-)